MILLTDPPWGIVTTMTSRLAGVALLIAFTLRPTPLLAQDTREAALERQRAEKAKQVEPYKPGKLEGALLWYQRVNPIEKVAPHNGFYAQYGYQFKPVGSGLGLGGGYRHDLFHRNARIDLMAGITLRNYQMLLADFSLPYLADNRFELGVHALYRHNPQEDFWGIGPDSLSDDRVSYRVNFTDYEARAIARPVRWLEAGTHVGWLSGSIGPGTDSRFPTIEDLFTDTTAPGLAAQPDYRYADVHGAIDYRDQKDNARSGGHYAVTWRRYTDLDFDLYNFREIEALVQQFVPIFDKKRVFAVQARLVTATPDEGQQVPFYFQPTVGGSTSLRSYNDFRFRDDTAVNFNFEYRWEAFAALDMALFYDLGTVAAEVDDISLSNLKDGYGIGFRFNTYKTVLYRIDIGFGGADGVRYFFKFSKAF
jgi:outer membrane protein assembly factor BamA